MLAWGVLGGCGSSSGPASSATIPTSLLREARTIGAGPRFRPPASGPLLGRCTRSLGRRLEAHVELFAANHVVLVAAGIGTRPPRRYQAGRIVSARCYGSVVTLDPTGIVYARAGSALTLADLFRSWGQPLSQSRLARFGAAAGTRVEVFVDGRRLYRNPRGVALSEHAEIVLEVGPHVPPHSAFVFPPTP
jgi:hypothetical protein